MNIKTIDLKTMPELKGKEAMIKFRNIGLQSENYISFTDSESAKSLHPPDTPHRSGFIPQPVGASSAPSASDQLAADSGCW